jgi:hypothetical protein
MPTPGEKEEAKQWVEKRSSCPAWRDGWCFVDGTLIPLAFRPFWYGQSYFDRKCNYSLNIQVFFTMQHVLPNETKLTPALYDPDCFHAESTNHQLRVWIYGEHT